MFQRISCGSNQSALGMGLLGKWVPAHEHFTLLLQLIVICLSLVGVLVAKGLWISKIHAFVLTICAFINQQNFTFDIDNEAGSQVG